MTIVCFPILFFIAQRLNLVKTTPSCSHTSRFPYTRTWKGRRQRVFSQLLFSCYLRRREYEECQELLSYAAFLISSAQSQVLLDCVVSDIALEVE